MILPQSFYNRPTLKVAQDLLGCFLISDITSPNPLLRKEGEYKNRSSKKTQNKTLPLRRGGLGGVLKYKIVETEAYVGPNDLASHASRGRTERNNVMFGEPGIIYVYFTYGMHYMLNIITEKKEYPAAVLIRALEPICTDAKSCVSIVSTNGPAKLTKALKIDKTFNHLPIYTKKHLPAGRQGGLWIEAPPTPRLRRAKQIVKTTRIGIDYAKEYKSKLWRFYIKNNKFVSKK